MQNAMSKTGDMTDMVAALAKQPADSRRVMMSERMHMFAEMDDKPRYQAMQAMTEALYALPDSDLRAMVETRTAVLAELPDDTRKQLMMTHMEVLKSFPEQQRMREMQMVQQAVGSLPPAQKQTMMAMLQGMASARAMPTNGGMAGGKPNQPPRQTTAATPPRSAPATTPTKAESPWAAWLTVLAGAWILISPFVLGATGIGRIHDVILGLAIIVLGLIGAIGRQTWANWLNVLAGIWMVAASFLLGYSGALRISDIVVGVLTVILAYLAVANNQGR